MHRGPAVATNFSIVCVGGSAGGLDAYKRLLRHLPADMGVAIVIVNHLRTVVAALSSAGYQSLAFQNSLAVLPALRAASSIEVLITSLEHGCGKPNGISLARMARVQRSGVKVVFVGPSELADHAAGLGEFLASPVKVENIVKAAVRVLGSAGITVDTIGDARC